MQASHGTENRMPGTGEACESRGDSLTSGSVSSFSDSASAFQWIAGVQLPPLTQSNPHFVRLCESVLDGTASDIPAMHVTDAVAVMVYRLVMTSRALSTIGIADFYVVLASIHHRRIVVRDPCRQRKLQARLERRSGRGGVNGLDVSLRYQVGQRKRDPVLRELSYDDAEAYLLRQWDLIPFNFDFGPAVSPCCGASGGCLDSASGLGPSCDPSCDGVEGLVPIVPTVQLQLLDIRTRTLEACLQMRAFAAAAERQRRGMRLSQWHRQHGVLPDNALRLIDFYVRGTRLSQARREETYELQLIRSRELIDTLRGEKAALEAMARAAELEALRAVRLREDAQSLCTAMLKAADEAARHAEREHGREMRERLRAANANFLERKKEMEVDRVLAQEQITRVQVENTELERQLNRARAALRSRGKEATSALAEVETELEKLREGRVWSRVREEQARRARAEDENARLVVEIERLLKEASSRSMQYSAEKQELRYLRHRVKDLQEKVAAYQAKSNRRFFEVEPIAEENSQLRTQLEVQARRVCIASRNL